LYSKEKSTINEYIKNIYLEHELLEEDTMGKFENSEFSTKPANYYNLDVIIVIGFRVNLQRVLSLEYGLIMCSKMEHTAI
jgi:hypothetical protein